MKSVWLGFFQYQDVCRTEPHRPRVFHGLQCGRRQHLEMLIKIRRRRQFRPIESFKVVMNVSPECTLLRSIRAVLTASAPAAPTSSARGKLLCRSVSTSVTLPGTLGRLFDGLDRCLWLFVRVVTFNVYQRKAATRSASRELCTQKLEDVLPVMRISSRSFRGSRSWKKKIPLTRHHSSCFSLSATSAMASVTKC